MSIEFPLLDPDRENYALTKIDRVSKLRVENLLDVQGSWAIRCQDFLKEATEYLDELEVFPIVEFRDYSCEFHDSIKKKGKLLHIGNLSFESDLHRKDLFLNSKGELVVFLIRKRDLVPNGNFTVYHRRNAKNKEYIENTESALQAIERTIAKSIG